VSVKRAITHAAGVSGAVVVLLGLSAPAAMAWDAQECADWWAEHGTVHPDCHPIEKKHPTPPPAPVPPPPPPPAPVAPAPVAPAPAPVAPAPVAPAPVAPAPAPVAPAPAPKSDTAPVAPKQENHGVKGKVETREEVATAPVAMFQADTSPSTGTLPLTGANALIQVLLGGFSLAGGGFLFRRTREA
jgi:LPXTG-motif cell wall-anchored protein